MPAKPASKTASFDIGELDTSVRPVSGEFYQELQISFLPGDRDVFLGWLDKIGKSKAAAAMLVGHQDDFANFLDTLNEFKAEKGVRNAAVALRLMAEYAGRAMGRQKADGVAGGKARGKQGVKKVVESNNARA